MKKTYGTFFNGKPCHNQRQIVTAGLNCCKLAICFERKGETYMTTRCGCTRYDCKCDTKAKSETYWENTTKCCYADLCTKAIRGRKCKGSDGSDSWEDVEEDTSRFSHAFSKDSRAPVLEIELSLRNSFRLMNMAGDMSVTISKILSESEFCTFVTRP